ncbi:MAG: hypothetical protein IEMM0008_0568 [bacterium]|nr:MAG: hypothetical protein IEMM0008_0568 [bacterium]
MENAGLNFFSPKVFLGVAFWTGFDGVALNLMVSGVVSEKEYKKIKEIINGSNPPLAKGDMIRDRDAVVHILKEFYSVDELEKKSF